MGSNFNFKNFGNEPPAGGGGGRPPGGGFPLTRQSSVYSLTFDELQSTVGLGSGKDFGSMNMDELLKSIWSAEENQNVGSTSATQEGVSNLQRQGSLILPRTLSQKTVDEVWRDVANKDSSGGVSGFGVPQKQPTLGEITLEEFLVRAGVVREENQLAAKHINNNSANSNVGSFGDLWHPVNSSALGFGFQQQNVGSNQIGVTASLPLNVNGVRSAENNNRLQQQQPHILPKQQVLGYGSQLGSPRINRGMVGISESAMNNAMVQNAVLQGGGLGMVGLGGNGVGVGRGSSPAVSSDGLSNGDTPTVSPVPYVFNGGLRGRKSAALEKVVERRQRRMIKNRESAARSRARKQAYTMELEAEVAKLKEEQEELQKKQAEIMEMQKNQVMEMMMKQENGFAKRQCLRRTQTGPW